MKFCVKVENLEPMTITAENHWEALRIVVHGYALQHLPVQGDFQKEHGCLTACVWATGKMYHVRPLKRGEKCGGK